MRRTATFGEAFFPFLVTIFTLVLCLMVFHLPLYWGLALGTVVALRLGSRLGLSAKELARAAIEGLRTTLLVSSILLAISLLVASWMASGTVAALISAGLHVLHANTLLVTGFWLMLLLSLLLGTSVGTLSTLGVALMGIGHGLGIPSPLMAGALISGASVGDRTSPFSGICNLVSSVSELPLRQTIKALLPTTLVSVSLATLVYAYWGTQFRGGNVNTAELIQQLQTVFPSHWLLYLPPVLVLIAVGFRFSTRTSLLLGTVSGLLIALLFQGQSVIELFQDLLLGYHLHSGTSLDTLMQGGGVLRMIPTFFLISFAGMFNGVMERIGALDILTQKFLGQIEHPESLKRTGMALSIAVALVVSNQAVPILITGRLLLPHFRRLKITEGTLARTLSDSVVVLTAFIPWNMYGILTSTTIGVPTLAYAPYALFLWFLPILTLLYPTKALGNPSSGEHA